MTTTTIRVSAKTHDTLRDLARAIGAPMQEILEQAVEQYRRQRLLAATDAAYAALRADPDAWQEVKEERATWNVTLADGLEGGMPLLPSRGEILPADLDPTRGHEQAGEHPRTDRLDQRLQSRGQRN